MIRRTACIIPLPSGNQNESRSKSDGDSSDSTTADVRPHPVSCGMREIARAKPLYNFNLDGQHLLGRGLQRVPDLDAERERQEINASADQCDSLRGFNRGTGVDIFLRGHFCKFQGRGKSAVRRSHGYGAQSVDLRIALNR
jgi:hypothetical protein